MKEGLQRYFIAILPDDQLSKQARSFQQELADTYNAKASLRSPPHITLHMPFEWKESKEGELKSALSEFFGTIHPLKLVIDGYGSFEPRVIYLNVAHSGELLDVQRSLSRFCRMHLNLFNALRGEKPFHPHITLAFRDLKKRDFYPAWEAYRARSFKAEFVADTVHLLKHDGARWHAYLPFELSRANIG